MSELDIETLRELLEYNPDNGVLTWKSRDAKWFKNPEKVAAWNGRYQNSIAGSKNQYGYIQIRINGRIYMAHRVAYAISKGYWPTRHIDHINGIRNDNRLANIRDVSVTENNRNAAKPKTNTSGVVGVYWCKSKNRWRAQIVLGNKTKNLGSFTNKQDAINARKQAEIDFSFHPNHGRER